jgi:hypothetical protein
MGAVPAVPAEVATMNHDEFDDVRQVDPYFDVVTENMTPGQARDHARHIRASLSYHAWERGVSPEELTSVMLAALDLVMARAYPDEP